MPTYPYRCSECQRGQLISCSIDARDEERPCPSCGRGKLCRGITSGLGLVKDVGEPPISAVGPPPRRAGPTISNCTFGEGEIAMSFGGGHYNVQDCHVSGAQTVFELENGASVDVRNLTNTVENAPPRSSRKERRQKRRKR